MEAWRGYRKSIDQPSKSYRTSIEHLSNIYRKSIEHLWIGEGTEEWRRHGGVPNVWRRSAEGMEAWRGYRKSIDQPSNIYRNLSKSIEHLSNIYRKSIEHLSNIYRTSIENLSNIYRKSIERGGLEEGWRRIGGGCVDRCSIDVR